MATARGARLLDQPQRSLVARQRELRGVLALAGERSYERRSGVHDGLVRVPQQTHQVGGGHACLLHRRMQGTLLDRLARGEKRRGASDQRCSLDGGRAQLQHKVSQLERQWAAVLVDRGVEPRD
tara:strand:- start:164 stop:535 length:372 start_codon:yes stop_codon:yes gene_type:complete